MSVHPVIIPPWAKIGIDNISPDNGFVPHETHCICRHRRELCNNYIRYGYDCAGFRYQDGQILTSPWGFKTVAELTRYPIGPIIKTADSVQQRRSPG